MDSTQVEFKDFAVELLNQLLRQFITLGVASIGFLFVIRKAGYTDTFPHWWFLLTLSGFCAQILFAILGQISVVVKAYGQKPAWGKWLNNPKLWFYLTWVGFCVGVGSFGFILFTS